MLTKLGSYQSSWSKNPPAHGTSSAIELLSEFCSARLICFSSNCHDCGGPLQWSSWKEMPMTSIYGHGSQLGYQKKIAKDWSCLVVAGPFCWYSKFEAWPFHDLIDHPPHIFTSRGFWTFFLVDALVIQWKAWRDQDGSIRFSANLSLGCPWKLAAS